MAAKCTSWRREREKRRSDEVKQNPFNRRGCTARIVIWCEAVGFRLTCMIIIATCTYRQRAFSTFNLVAVAAMVVQSQSRFCASLLATFFSSLSCHPMQNIIDALFHSSVRTAANSVPLFQRMARIASTTQSVFSRRKLAMGARSLPFSRLY